MCFSHRGRGMCDASEHHRPRNIISAEVEMHRRRLTVAVNELNLLGTRLFFKTSREAEETFFVRLILMKYCILSEKWMDAKRAHIRLRPNKNCCWKCP